MVVSSSLERVFGCGFYVDSVGNAFLQSLTAGWIFRMNKNNDDKCVLLVHSQYIFSWK